MNIGQFIFVCNENNLDVDVYSDYTDDLAIAYCGDDVSMTEEGLNEFGDILDIEVNWKEGDKTAIVKINDLPDDIVEDVNWKIVKLFQSLAGYCSNENYEKWFRCED